MLTLKKSRNQIEIVSRTKSPFLTRDLLIAFFIALSVHLSFAAAFTIRTILQKYDEPLVQNITLSPSQFMLQIDSGVKSRVEAPPSTLHFPSVLPQILLANVIDFVNVDTSLPSTSYSLSSSLADRLYLPPPPPKTAFTKLNVKIDDRTGKLFYFEADEPLSTEMRKWVLSLSFRPLNTATITNGILEIEQL